MAESHSSLYDTGEPLKRCSVCRQMLPFEAFPKRFEKKRGRFRPHSFCRECRKVVSKEWRRKFPDRHRASMRRYHLEANFGLTVQQYDAMLSAQGGRCAICSRTPDENFKYRPDRPFPLGVDHDHKTGKIRGLLCTRCNVMIGNASDDPKILELAIAYLLQHRVPGQTS